MAVFNVLGLLVMAYFLNFVHSLTEMEVKKDFIKTIMLCNKENPVEMTELLQLQALKTPKRRAPNAFWRFDEKGLYDLEEGYKFAELTKEGDEKRLQNGRKLAEICSKVNNMEVTDGEKGCDRAAFFFQCLIENAPKLGFKV